MNALSGSTRVRSEDDVAVLPLLVVGEPDAELESIVDVVEAELDGTALRYSQQ